MYSYICIPLIHRCYLIILSRECICFLALEDFFFNLLPKYFFPNEGKKGITIFDLIIRTPLGGRYHII